MTFYTNVAPKRRVQQKPKSWHCWCTSKFSGLSLRRLRKWNPGYLRRCPDCKAERPAA